MQTQTRGWGREHVSRRSRAEEGQHERALRLGETFSGRTGGSVRGERRTGLCDLRRTSVIDMNREKGVGEGK